MKESWKIILIIFKIIWLAENYFILFLFLISIFPSLMKRQNVWDINRGYIQHLNVLRKINSRKKPGQQSKRIKNVHQQQSRHGYSRSQRKSLDQFKDSACIISNRQSSAVKEQKLLWDNYYLGKRIIETQPVISKKKLDEDYRKHKRMVQCLTASTNKRNLPNQFRVKKLQQYKENVQFRNEQRTKIVINCKYFIQLHIIRLAFYRYKPSLDNLTLMFYYEDGKGRTHKQESQKFNVDDIAAKQFYFKAAKRHIVNQEPLRIQIRNIKGLEEHSLGLFAFPSSISLRSYTAKIFHLGEALGEIQIQTSYGSQDGKIPNKQQPKQS